MRADLHADRSIEAIREAKEAYLQALRQAYLDGVDPCVLVQAGILNRACRQLPKTSLADIDLTDAGYLPDPGDGDSSLANESLCGHPVAHYLG